MYPAEKGGILHELDVPVSGGPFVKPSHQLEANGTLCRCRDYWWTGCECTKRAARPPPGILPHSRIRGAVTHIGDGEKDDSLPTA